MELTEKQFEEVITTEPVRQKDICETIKILYDVDISPRHLRNFIKAHNDAYNAGGHDDVIVDLGFGTFRTKEDAYIKPYNKRRTKHAFSELLGAYYCEKRRNLNKNLSFELFVMNELEEQKKE